MFDANVEEFIAWDNANPESIKLKRSFVELTGDLNAGILLSQIVYWHLPDKKGETKLRVRKHGGLWLAKKRTDWWDECCLNPKQFDRAIAILEGLDLVNCALFRFAGSPTKHIQLKWNSLLNGLKALSSKFLPKREYPNPPDSDFQMDKEGNFLTETTAKITSETTGRVISVQRTTTCNTENTRISVSEKTHIDRAFSQNEFTNGMNGNVATLEKGSKTAIAASIPPSNPVNTSGSGESKPKQKKERPAILPKNKKLDYDDFGWVKLPVRNSQYKLACKLAIRRMQIWLVQTYFSDLIEVSRENGKPYFVNGKGYGNDEGDEEEFFKRDGDQALPALRNYALAHNELCDYEYNEKLEELFWDSVDVVAEHGGRVSAILKAGTVYDNFDD